MAEAWMLAQRGEQCGGGAGGETFEGGDLQQGVEVLELAAKEEIELS
jgi:hypothetical protein